MQSIRYIDWQDGESWLGYLEDYRDSWTQGETLDDLVDHLKDLHADMTSGAIPGIRKVGVPTIS